MGNVYRVGGAMRLSERSEVREGCLCGCILGDYHIISIIYYRFVSVNFWVRCIYEMCTYVLDSSWLGRRLHGWIYWI